MSTSKFGAKTKALEVVEGIDLTNKNFIVTGASSGIGVETARALAKAGGRVVLAVRDTKKGEEVAKDIRESTKNPNVEVEKLELDSLESVNAFVKRYLDKKRPLHCLINNAGMMGYYQSYTRDGFEMMFGTNHMGHFALTIGLIPSLIDAYKQTSKKSRVVNVSSTAHVLKNVNFTDINFRSREYDSFEAYSQSKTANVLFSVALTELYSEQGIVSNALMPGSIRTGIQKHFPVAAVDSWFDPKTGIFKDITKTIEEGASTQVWAAVAPELEGVGGHYFENCDYSELFKPEKIMKSKLYATGYAEFALNKENAIKLWNLSMEWLKNPPK